MSDLSGYGGGYPNTKGRADMSTRKLEAAVTALCIGAMLGTFAVIGAAWWLG